MQRPRFATLIKQSQECLERRKSADFFASGMDYRIKAEAGTKIAYDRMLSDQTGEVLLQYLQAEVKDSKDKDALLQAFKQNQHFAWTMFVEGYNHECQILDRSAASQNPATALFDISPDGKALLGLKDKTIKHVVIPDGAERIGQGSFQDKTTIETISFPNSLKCIHVAAFRDCSSLKEVVFPSGLESISNCAFFGCSSLKEVVLPTGLLEVFEGAFLECSSLENVVIPDFTVNHGITSPGLVAFAFGGKSLKSIHIQFKDPDKANLYDDFRDIDYDRCTLYVPKGSKAAYLKRFPRFKHIVGE